MRRIIGLILVGLGVAAFALGLTVQSYALPQLSVAPLDLDPKDTSNSSGTVALVADLPTGTQKENVALVGTRRTTADVAASQQAGGNIGVYETIQVVSLASDSSGQPYLPTGVDRYAFDRTTSYMVATAGANVDGTQITEAMVGTDTVMPLKFPFNTQQQTYKVFDTSLMTGVDTQFVDAEEIDGLQVYKFQSTVPATKIGMQGDAELWYQNTSILYVEPTTGQIVDGSSQQKNWLKNPDGTDGLVIIDGTLSQTDQEVADSVAAAKANASKLAMLKSLPMILFGIGAIALVIGIVLLVLDGRRQSSTAV